MVNQKLADLGIPNRFNLSSSRFSNNSCAAYGPDFAKVNGTETCVKIGGAVSIGAGTAGGRR